MNQPTNAELVERIINIGRTLAELAAQLAKENAEQTDAGRDWLYRINNPTHAEALDDQLMRCR